MSISLDTMNNFVNLIKNEQYIDFFKQFNKLIKEDKKRGIDNSYINTYYNLIRFENHYIFMPQQDYIVVEIYVLKNGIDFVIYNYFDIIVKHTNNIKVWKYGMKLLKLKEINQDYYDIKNTKEKLGVLLSGNYFYVSLDMGGAYTTHVNTVLTNDINTFFLILKGNHLENYKKIIDKGLKECIKYFLSRPATERTKYERSDGLLAEASTDIEYLIKNFN